MRYLRWQQKLGEWYWGLFAPVRTKTHLRGVYWEIFQSLGTDQAKCAGVKAVLMNCHCAIPETARPPMRSEPPCALCDCPVYSPRLRVFLFVLFVCLFLFCFLRLLRVTFILNGASWSTATNITQINQRSNQPPPPPPTHFTSSSKYLNIPAAWRSRLLFFFPTQKLLMLSRSDEEEAAFISWWEKKWSICQLINYCSQCCLAQVKLSGSVSNRWKWIGLFSCNLQNRKRLSWEL